MQIKVTGEILTHTDAADAITVSIERRGKDPNTQMAGQHRQDTPCDTAFRWHAHFINPFPRRIIHAAATHDTQNACDVFLAHGTLACEEIEPTMRQRCGHYCQITAGHCDRALLKVKIDYRCGIAEKNAEVAEHKANGPIAVPGALFRLIDQVIYSHPMTSIAAKLLQDTLEAVRG